MNPDLETMISDIVKWVGRPNGIEIWYDPEWGMYCVRAVNETWRNSSLVDAVSYAWSYVDRARQDNTFTIHYPDSEDVSFRLDKR